MQIPFWRRLLVTISLAAITSTAGAGTEEALSFEIEAFPVDHQGPQVIDVITELIYVAGIDDKEYPDFEAIRAELITWMTDYPNESDYWEVFNRVLCRRLLETYPMVASAEITIKVYPTFSIQYAHTSRCRIDREE